VLRQPALPPLEPEQRDELQRLLDEP